MTLPSKVITTADMARDDHDLAIAQNATGLLRIFNKAGVLGLADVHTATRIAQIGGEHDDRVRLALALTVSALRRGSVCIDLASVSETVFDEADEQIDLSGLPWPQPQEWISACEASSLVAAAPTGGDGRPLRLAFGLLYLQRYWMQEEIVRTQLTDRRSTPPPTIDLDRLESGLQRIFSLESTRAARDESAKPRLGPDLQRTAALISAISWITVLAGGPGTGKTTTVAKLLALLCDQPGPRPRIALAAPTGKAAARLEEAVTEARRTLPATDNERLGDLHASTLHRLLGWLPGNQGRFRHDANHHLPFDVIVVDEMSMVSLTMMARLLEAVRPDARLILVGDPDQLSSVEAGAVLADIVQAAEPQSGNARPQHNQQTTTVPSTGQIETAALSPGQPLRSRMQTMADVTEDQLRHGVIHLQQTWRFDGAIEQFARAVRWGNADDALAILRSSPEDLIFTATELDVSQPAGLGQLMDMVRETGQLVDQAARSGDVEAALRNLDRHRLLCAHRRGPYGVARWSREAERWLREAIPEYGSDAHSLNESADTDRSGRAQTGHRGASRVAAMGWAEGEWYVGRPLLVTANDYDSGLYNGDTGVVVRTHEGIRAAFARGSAATLYSPVRLDDVQTFYAMTVHRAQGSQFRAVSFLLPPPESHLLTRELLYTAVTRATERVMIYGSEEAIRRAITRPANRASGLRNRL